MNKNIEKTRKNAKLVLELLTRNLKKEKEKEKKEMKDTKDTKKNSGTCSNAVVVNDGGREVNCCQHRLGLRNVNWRTGGLPRKDIPDYLCLAETVISASGKKLITEYRPTVAQTSHCFSSGVSPCISYAI